MRHCVEGGWLLHKKVIKAGTQKDFRATASVHRQFSSKKLGLFFFFLRKGHSSHHLRSPIDMASHPQ